MQIHAALANKTEAAPQPSCWITCRAFLIASTQSRSCQHRDRIQQPGALLCMQTQQGVAPAGHACWKCFPKGTKPHPTCCKALHPLHLLLLLPHPKQAVTRSITQVHQLPMDLGLRCFSTPPKHTGTTLGFSNSIYYNGAFQAQLPSWERGG